jgi:acyl carrier protein
MTREEVLSHITEVFKEVLDHEDIQLSEATTASDVEDWDSLNHIQLVVAVEKKFKVRFTSKEIQSWGNVGEMMTCILSK